MPVAMAGFETTFSYMCTRLVGYWVCVSKEWSLFTLQTFCSTYDVPWTLTVAYTSDNSSGKLLVTVKLADVVLAMLRLKLETQEYLATESIGEIVAERMKSAMVMDVWTIPK